MAHAPGDEQTHDLPAIMRDYRSGGTPWTVIIDPAGKVVFNNFHIDAEPATAFMKMLLAQKTSHTSPLPSESSKWAFTSSQ